MKNINLKVVLLSFVITASVLFGSWFAMQFFQLERPITDWFSQNEKLELTDVKVIQNKVHLWVRFNDHEDFATDLLDLQTYVQQLTKDKELFLHFEEKQSEQHPWWLKHSANILQFLADKQYAEIDQLLSDWQDSGVIKSAHFVMNSKYIFIYIKPSAEQDAVYLMFPTKRGGDET